MSFKNKSQGLNIQMKHQLPNHRHQSMKMPNKTQNCMPIKKILGKMLTFLKVSLKLIWFCGVQSIKPHGHVWDCPPRRIIPSEIFLNVCPLCSLWKNSTAGHFSPCSLKTAHGEQTQESGAKQWAIRAASTSGLWQSSRSLAREAKEMWHIPDKATTKRKQLVPQLSIIQYLCQPQSWDMRITR